MSTKACHSLIALVFCMMVEISVQRQRCIFGNYCSGSHGDMKAVCKGGYCYCTGQNYGYESCLPDAYGCRIIMNSNNALGKPLYNRQPRTTYSCTPGKSSPRYEVHVLSVYEVINRRPPRAGDATVNIVSQGNPKRSIILVLASYEPVKWILNLPTGLTISKVILVAFYAVESSVTGDIIGQVQSIEKRQTRWGSGIGSDSGGGNTPKLLKVLHDKYGVVTSFTGTYRANKWSLSISSSQAKGTAATSTQHPSTASPVYVTNNSYDLSTVPISTLKMHSGENDQNRGSDDTVQGTTVVLGLLGGLLVVICVGFIAKCTYAKILKSRNDGPVNVNAICTNDGTAVSQPDHRPNGYAVRTNNVPEASRPALVNNLWPWTSRPEAPYPSYATVTNNVTVSSCPDDPPPLYALVSKHGSGDSLPDYPPPSYEDATNQRVAASCPNDPPPACVVRTDDGTTGLRRDDLPLGCAATTIIA